MPQYVAVMDIGMEDLNGIEATAQILRESPRTAILILSMFSEERYVKRAMKAGALGYLLKDSVEEDLVRAIRAVRFGQSFFSPRVARILLDGYTRVLKERKLDDLFDLPTPAGARDREQTRM